MNNLLLKKYFKAKLFSSLVFFIATLISQGSFAADLPVLNTLKLKQTIIEVTDKIRKLYVIEAEGEKIAQSIMSQYKAGNYNELNGVSLAKKITDDLYLASNDLHMYINYDPESASKAASDGNKEQTHGQPSAAELAVFKSRAQDVNFGYQDFKWLAEKVAVISITQWHPLSWTEEKINSMMQLAEGANAIIFDVRSNGGGSPEGARYIQGHFLNEVVDMIIFRNRQEEEPFIDSSAASVKGKKRVGIPMYVLIDSKCGSACEDFAVTSRDAGLATLVGETTAGAGYMNSVMPIADTFQMSVSIAGAFSAKTGDHWQTKGVSPDVEVLAPDALNKAYAIILAELAAKSLNPNEKQRIKRREAWIKTDLSHNERSLVDYQANYDGMAVKHTGRYLKLSKGHMSHYYKRVSEDTFEEAIRGETRLRFNRDHDSNIISYSLLTTNAKMKTFQKQ